MPVIDASTVFTAASTSAITIAGVTGLQAALDAKATTTDVAAAQAAADGHAALSDNPHGVTQAQVGLDNVDNTSDMDKPVSTAQAADIAHGLAYVNIIANGSHQISQENGSASGSAWGYYPSDQWTKYHNGSVAATAQRVVDAPPGFAYSVKIAITTPEPALGATSYLFVEQRIEKLRMRHLAFGTANAKVSQLGVWVKSSVAGSYAVSIRSGDLTRSWLGSIAISSANTWEYKTFTVDAQTLGAWGASENVMGCKIGFCVAAATAYSSSAGSQSGGDLIGITGQTNLAATNGETFQFTGVTWLPGSVTLSADNAWMMQRHADDELRICQRYFEFLSCVVATTFSSTGRSEIFYAAEKRTNPSLSALVNVGSGAAFTESFYTPKWGAYQTGANSVEASCLVTANARM